MSELPEALTQKAGPLPVGVWLLAIGGGLAVATLVRRSATTAKPAGDASTDGTGYFGAGLDNTQPGIGNPYAGMPASNPTATGYADAPTSNEDWQRRALVKLIASGYSPFGANEALSAYLYGAALNPQQRALVDEAIRAAGAPPAPPAPAPSGELPAPIVGDANLSLAEQARRQARYIAERGTGRSVVPGVAAGNFTDAEKVAALQFATGQTYSPEQENYYADQFRAPRGIALIGR